MAGVGLAVTSVLPAEENHLTVLRDTGSAPYLAHHRPQAPLPCSYLCSLQAGFVRTEQRPDVHRTVPYVDGLVALHQDASVCAEQRADGGSNGLQNEHAE